MTSVAVLSKPPFSKKTLVKDPNCVLIQDPSAIWGGSDHLPRRNLLTYSEDFSNAVWAKTETTVSANTTTDPIGGNAADSLLETTNTLSHYALTTANVVSGALYAYSLYIKGKNRDYCFAFLSGTGFISGSNIVIPLIRLSTREVTIQPSGTSSRADVTCTAEDAGDSWVKVTITTTAVATGSANLGLYVSADGVWANRAYAGNANNGLYLWGAQLTLASTTDQSYQRVTDWVTEQYAWAATKNVPWLRRNKLVNTSALNLWTVSGNETISSGVTDPFGGTSGLSVTCSNTTSSARYAYQTVTTTIGITEYYVVYVKRYASSTYLARFNMGDAGNVATTYFNPVTGAFGTIHASFLNAAVETVNGWYKITFSRVATGTSSYFTCGICPTETTGSFVGTVGEGVCFSHPSMAPAPGVSYQEVGASWAATYTALALAAGYPISLYSDRAGTTATYGPDDPVGVLLDQSENLSGAVGGKRNLLTYSEDFSNAAWTKLGVRAFGSGSTVDATEAPSGVVSADLITEDNAASAHQVQYSYTATASTTYTASVYVKSAVGSRNVSVRPINATAAGSTRGVTVNISNGSFVEFTGSVGDNPTYTITPIGGEWFRVSVTATCSVSGSASVAIALVSSNALTYTGDNTSGIYIWGAQLEVGSTPTPYQKVTDTWWNGSVPGYHATAPSVAGSPTLRLDGNGRWYLDRDTTDDNLPIVWPTNLTSTGVIYTATGDYTTKDSGLILSGATDYKFPQRPSGDYGRIVMKAESKYDAKIIKYLDQKRGRSYQLGPELVSNGDFSNGTTGWTVANTANSTISAATGVLSIQTPVTTEYPNVSQAIFTQGKTYLLSIQKVSGVTGNFQDLEFRCGNTTHRIYDLTPGTYQFIDRADAVNTLMLIKRGTTTSELLVDNISVREILL